MFLGHEYCLRFSAEFADGSSTDFKTRFEARFISAAEVVAQLKKKVEFETGKRVVRLFNLQDFS